MPDICLERHDACLLIRLDRPQRLNALTPHMVAELDEALDRADADATLRTLLICGSGRAFCAGADLEFADPDLGPGHAAVTSFLHRLGELFLRIERFGKPVLAAVNGLALGGGLELVLCCDLVLAAESARLGDGHAGYGFVPAGGASVRLPRRLGLTRAKYLMYTGALQTAGELCSAGLINEVVPDDQLHDRSLAVARLMAERSPLALTRMKQLLHDGLEQPVESALRAELVMSDVHRRSNDNREGVRAFREKRRPRFDGT